MVPGITEREIRHHASSRQEWLRSESGLADHTHLAERRGLRSTLSEALQAITSLRGSRVRVQVQSAPARPIVLETAQH